MAPDPFMPRSRGGASDLADRIWMRWTSHPATFLLGPLAVSVLGALALPGGTPGVRARMLLTAALYAAWVPLWTRRRGADPDVRKPLRTAVLGAVGALLVAQLMTLHVMFGLTVVATIFNLALALPLWSMVPVAAGVIYVVDLKFAELLTRVPGGVPWSVVVLHALVVLFLTTMVKALASKNEERRRLLETLAVVERRAGQAEERQRLGREIHDTFAQGFAGILRHLEAAELSAPAGAPAELAAHLRRAREVARENLEEARRMMAALRPELLDGRALEEAVRRAADDFSRRTGVPASLAVTGDGAALHPEVEVTLLRATQEALANVAAHAGAAAVTVTLSYMDDVVALDVRDDGRGVAPGAAGSGFGLRAMRERAELLGGTWTLESAPREGTTVSVCLPRLPAVAGVAGAPAPATVPQGAPPRYQYSPAVADLRHQTVPAPTTSPPADAPAALA
jgi:signal transduction histidine kinase